MATAKFKMYMHEDYNSYELSEHIANDLKKQGIEVNEDKMQSALSKTRPFYEVELDCEIDLDTFEVKLLTARL